MKKLIYIFALCALFSCERKGAELIDSSKDNNIERVIDTKWDLSVFKVQVDSVWYVIASTNHGVCIVKHSK